MTALILNWRRAYEAGVLSCGGKGHHLAKLPWPCHGHPPIGLYAILLVLGLHIDTVIAAAPEMKGGYR